jgi:hypothetical protein
LGCLDLSDRELGLLQRALLELIQERLAVLADEFATVSS